MSVWVVVGGQFGSEGKGKVSAIITLQEQIDVCVRCGGPNSGHSVVDEFGQTVALRQLPTGYIRKQTRLLIPAGGLIDLSILRSEIESLKVDPARIGIDRSAMLITERDRERERSLGLSERLSSTLSGVGSAVASRALRDTGVRLASDAASENDWLRPLLTDVSGEVNRAVNIGQKVLIEGTQGSGLSLYHSGQYPKVTSRDTNAAGFISEVGLSPRLVTEIVLVLRTFPIRVAGLQSGQLANELTWEQVQEESGCPYPLREYTTVTKKLRRIGRFDWHQAAKSFEINRPTRLVLNFLDYIAFSNRTAANTSQVSEPTRQFLNSIADRFRTPLYHLGAGPRVEDGIPIGKTFGGPDPETQLSDRGAAIAYA